MKTALALLLTSCVAVRVCGDSPTSVTLSLDMGSSFVLGETITFEIVLLNPTSETIYIPGFRLHPRLGRDAFDLRRGNQRVFTPANEPYPISCEGKMAFPCYTINAERSIRARHDLPSSSLPSNMLLEHSASLPGTYTLTVRYLPERYPSAAETSGVWRLVPSFPHEIRSETHTFAIIRPSPDRLARLRGEGDLTDVSGSSLAILLASGDKITWMGCEEEFANLGKDPEVRTRKQQIVLDSLAACPSGDLRRRTIEKGLLGTNARIIRVIAVDRLAKWYPVEGKARLEELQNSDPDDQIREVARNRLRFKRGLPLDNSSFPPPP